MPEVFQKLMSLPSYLHFNMTDIFQLENHKISQGIKNKGNFFAHENLKTCLLENTNFDRVKPAIDGSNLGWFSRDWPKFDPCMRRLIVAKHVQPACQISSMQLSAATAASNIHCVLPTRSTPRAPCWENTIALREGFSVDGEIKGFPFLQPLLTGKKIKSSKSALVIREFGHACK